MLIMIVFKAKMLKTSQYVINGTFYNIFLMSLHVLHTWMSKKVHEGSF